MSYLDDLNPEQRKAVETGDGPVLVIAGAGSGKTRTLAYRVAHLVKKGVRPENILLLTFTRRSAQEMLRRAQGVFGKGAGATPGGTFGKVWGGTFHATANRLLRSYGKAVQLSQEFTVLDEGDSRNLMDMAKRAVLEKQKQKRFPRKGTLVAIYSRTVNTGKGARALDDIVYRYYPYVIDYLEELQQIFKQYTTLKRERSLLDYDDLLIFWLELLNNEKIASMLDERFHHVLVDEYQDTNPLQAQILQLMRKKNSNIMVVGDDAQSIYSFRAATVRNILDFPKQFPGTTTITLTQNYRSIPPILDVTNQVISFAKEQYTKELWSEREGDQKPYLVTCKDEREQTNFVVEEILNHHEEGIDLKQQAVLFRAGQLSADLETELVRHNIPYHKFGGLRYLEAAHIKDLMSFFRALENPSDDLAWYRLLTMIPRVGQKTAGRIYRELKEAQFSVEKLATLSVPKGAEETYRDLAALLTELEQRKETPLPEQVRQVRKFYDTIIEEIYDNPEARKRDLNQLETIAQRYKNRRQFLTDLTLDPPNATSDFAADPHRDEDYLVLSTIHSAKGLEFDVVYVIHAADGLIPSDMATDSDEEVEEERRLLYVAMTRARNTLYVTFPLRYYSRPFGNSDFHNYAQLTRFIPPELFSCFEQVKLSKDYLSDEFLEDQDLEYDIRDKWSF